MKPRTDVLIAGAGPTGLVLALWLHHQGVKVHILDQAEAPTRNSRAIVVHARIVELYRQLGLAEDLLKLGYKLPATNLWINGQHKAHIPLQEFGRDLTAYPFLLTVPQDEHEKMLERRLNDIGIHVERKTKLQDFVDHGSSITATLSREADGTSFTLEASYIIGCDGARSVVRHEIGAKYEGETYEPLFYIADIEGKDDKFFNGEGHLIFTNDTYNVIVPYNKAGHARLVGITTPRNNENYDHESHTHEHRIAFEDVRPQIMKAMNIDITKINWFSTHRSHHRVAEKFRHNRAFLAGDAAHIHSPVGGQGMNTGIMDAINLAWKLATVLKQTNMTEDAKHQLLESYESERRSFAMMIVKSTDTGFTTLTSKGFIPHIVRTWVIPYLLPLVLRLGATQSRIFKGCSQLICNYRGSSLSQPEERAVQAGDRLPWVKMEKEDNFSTLRYVCWQLHVYGECLPQLEEWTQDTGVKMFAFDWHDRYAEAGLVKDAVYLLRPDQYIAGIFEGPDVKSELDEYFATRGLKD
jgi:2-polyprenyl-6-methoxyphenol hydroxylase-like FAD-dependent oxidoreductase